MATTEVKIGEWINQGFNLFKENVGLLVLASLVAWLISCISVTILMGPMTAGMALIVFGLYKKATPKPELKTLFDGFQYFGQTLLLWVIIFILHLVLMILNVIPVLGWIIYTIISFILMSIFIFAVFLIVDKGMEFWPALMSVIEKIKANLWPMLGFFIIAALIAGVGSILCGIGIIATFPIGICILAVAYHEIYA
jgi:hypothetical protein